MADLRLVKDFNATPGVIEDVAPGLRRVLANNPGPFTHRGTGVYIVGEGEIAVVDPGPDDDAHIDALIGALKGERVTHILITHTHRDHCGGARKFADAVDAPLFGFGPHPASNSAEAAPALDEGADFDYSPDIKVADGDTFEGPGWRVEALHTPGHLSNHLCFAYLEQKALFTGDHVMGWSTSVVAPPDGDMGDYYESLDKLIARDDDVYYPTHGAPVPNGRALARGIKAHRIMRDGQIMAQLRDGQTQIPELVAAMYADIDKRLHRAAALNVYAHLIRLVRIGAVACDGEPKPKSQYTIVEQ
ncbi:MAG: MBL fold metallo-hydrolase [Pseudomonadota bacterium]